MDIVTLGAAKSAIKKAVSGLYKPAGSTAFADLPTPAVGNLGYTYIVTDAFTSDSRFTDYDAETQTGHSYPADTEVTVVITGTAESPVYKFDALGGIMDGYATKEEVAAIINDTTASSTSTYSSNKINSEVAGEEIAASVSGASIAVTDSADSTVQGLTVYGRSRVSKNLISIVEETKEVGGVTVTIDKTAGTLTFNGTATNNFDFYPFNQLSNMPTAEYYFTIGLESAYAGIKGIAKPSYFNVNPSTIMDTSPAGMYLQIASGTSFNNLTLKPMICLTSEGTDFEPYGAIISIGDSGSLTTTTANSDNSESTTATVTTGIPLCGIPVTTGETYTDEQGQKWLADTADVEGVVKRCYKVTFDGSADENIQIYSGSVTGADGSKAFYINLPYASVPISANVLPNIVTNYNIDTAQNGYDGTSQYGTLVYTSTDGAKLGGRIAGASTVSGVKTALASNPVTVVYELATPTTQELTSAEKSALLALRTFDSTTNVIITDSPYADIDYLKNTNNGKAVADVAENIIDRVPFIVESVSLDDLIKSETRSATEVMASSNPTIGVPNIYIPSTSQTIQANNDLSRFSDQYTGSDIWTWLNQVYSINHGYMNNSGEPDWIKVGDVTSIDCGTHGTYQVRVIGINQYASTSYSDISQDNVTNIAFQFVTAWDESFKYRQVAYNGGTDWTEAGGCPYRGSDLYGILNYLAVMRPLSPTPHADNYASAPSNAVLYSLPASLKTALMPKYLTMDKRYTDVNTVLTEDNGTVQISLGKVWVPTEAEVYGRSIYGSNYATNGNVQYEYFKYNPFFEGWLATPEEGNSTNFLYNTLAGVTSYAADTAHYVRPCFSVAITGDAT